MLNKIEYYWSKLLKKIRFKAVVDSQIHKTSKVSAGSQVVGSTIGKHSDVGYDCVIINSSIGAFCSLGANIIIGGPPHTLDWVSTSPVFNENKDHLPQKFAYHKFSLDTSTKVGNDVWIGNNVLIKANVTIGDGAVLGMGSVVTKNVGPYEIWGGNPARMIRKRFDDDVIEKLLDTKWWEWDDKAIKESGHLFNDVKAFIGKKGSH